jgi:DNA-binding NarL/FixJ family response regulator
MDDLAGVRVLVVDDSAQWRRLVAEELVGRHALLVGTAIDGLQAVDKARACRPDVIVMDLWMPCLNGLAATREIVKIVPESNIVIVSNESDPAIVEEALNAGARGYVAKSRVGVELPLAVSAAARGEQFVSKCLRGDCHLSSPAVLAGKD